MVEARWFSIAFLSLTLMVALYLVIFIRKAIQQKPPASQTIIDLIYCDCIFFYYFVGVFFSIGIICCLASDESAISFLLALTLVIVSTVFVLMFTFSLMLTGLLRLMTLITKSEEFGIQLLGPGTN